MKKGRPPKEEIITVIINSRLKHSLLPDNYEIIEIGIGKTFIEIYKKQYNIK